MEEPASNKQAASAVSSLLPNLLAHLASTIPRPNPLKRDIICAIDGPDASGKTIFTEALASRLRSQGQETVVIHLDDFLNTRSTRHAKGRYSPEGFYHDTYNYQTIKRCVLDPFQSDGSRNYRAKATDLQRDLCLSEAESPWISAPPDGVIVLVEGMFLHRGELAGYWVWSMFLFVPFEVTAKRTMVRDGSGNGDPECEALRRYVGGQRIYYKKCEPWKRAGWVVDNSDVGRPRIVEKDELELLGDRIFEERLSLDKSRNEMLHP
jgi:uridine kinase